MKTLKTMSSFCIDRTSIASLSLLSSSWRLIKATGQWRTIGVHAKHNSLHGSLQHHFTRMPLDLGQFCYLWRFLLAVLDARSDTDSNITRTISTSPSGRHDTVYASHSFTGSSDEMEYAAKALAIRGEVACQQCAGEREVCAAKDIRRHCED